MATEAIRIGAQEAKVLKVMAEKMNISKEEALRTIFRIALKSYGV